MIIKSKSAVVDTETYNCFYVDRYRSLTEYRLKAVNKNTSDEVVLITVPDTKNNKIIMEKIIKLITEFLSNGYKENNVLDLDPN